MKINRLDAHDRLLYLKKTQSNDIGECCQDLINQKPFGDHPFYILAHARTAEDGFNKNFILMPWPIKHPPETNSMMFKAYPGTDRIDVLWIIPARELWPQYKKGNITESEIVCYSIYKFENDRESLAAPDDSDLSPEQAQEVLFEFQPQLFKRDTLPEHKKIIWDQKMRERELAKREISEASTSALDLQADNPQ